MGEIDLRIAPLISWRIIQGDAVVMNYFSGVQQSARMSTGNVLRV
jgi:hypothetical protein